VATVLELGCGYGRLLAPLARAGHRVTGVDADAGLLTLARETVAALPAPARERVTLLADDMRTFALDARFERVLIPYNGLYCLPSEAEQIACLANAARHLAPGGRLVFDGYAIDAFHEAVDEDDEHDDAQPVVSVEWRGRVWDVLEHSDWVRAAQVLRVRYECRPRDGGAPVMDAVNHRYLLTGQVGGVCEAAGLRVVETAGGFRGEPLDADSEHLVCVAETG
jgi:SAM-dependent methyltransferase